MRIQPSLRFAASSPGVPSAPPILPGARPIVIHPTQFAMLSFVEIEAMRRGSGSDWRVYSVLALHCNDQQECWPGRQRLAHLTDLLPDHVSRALSRLESRGLITRRIGPQGYTVYTLPLHQNASAPWPQRTPTPPKMVVASAQPLPERVDRTDPLFEQTSESTRPAPTLEPPAPPTPEPAVALSPSHSKTPPPDQLPDHWLEIAGQLRPELAIETVRISAARFIDYHRARGTVLIDWLPAWRNWIRQERAPKPPINPSETRPTQPTGSTAAQEAVDRAYKARMDAADRMAEERRQKLLAAHGINEHPVTDPVSATELPEPASPDPAPSHPTAGPTPSPKEPTRCNPSPLTLPQQKTWLELRIMGMGRDEALAVVQRMVRQNE